MAWRQGVVLLHQHGQSWRLAEVIEVASCVIDDFAIVVALNQGIIFMHVQRHCR